ncbi:MAG TPA: RDD family protein [Burkholderiales bacterium]|nr:RDD family protein [Burkholderiales bacterium]
MPLIPRAARPSGFWRRFASLGYEAILLFGLLFISGYLFVSLTRDAQHGWLRALFQLYLLAVCGAYFVFCWVRSGQTLAMKTWGLRVVAADGATLTVPRAFVRYLLAVPSVCLAVGLLWALFDRDRQFLHDRLAGTKIVIE